VASAANPPATSPQRGPNPPASAPTTGAPIGVDPRKTTEYRAITRPRISPAASCSDEFTPAANMTLAAPSGTRMSSCTHFVGATAARIWAAPNSAADDTSSRPLTLPRKPEISAPAIAPTPIAAMSVA